MELADEGRDELLRQTLLQLISYHAEAMDQNEQMRNQLMALAHIFGVRPKDISKASDLTATRVHQIIAQMKAGGTMAARERAEQLMAQAHQLMGKGE